MNRYGALNQGDKRKNYRNETGDEMNDRVVLSNATVKYCGAVSVKAKRRKTFGVQAE